MRGWGGGVETHSLGFLLIQESIGGLPSICLPCDEFFDGSDEDEMPIYLFSISQVGKPLLSCNKKGMDVTEKTSRQTLGFGSVSYLSLKDIQYQVAKKKPSLILVGEAAGTPLNPHVPLLAWPAWQGV